MKLRRTFVTASSALFAITFAFAYEPNTTYLADPDSAKALIAQCADFWLQTADSVHGGYYTYKYPNTTPLNLTKSFAVQSCNAYGFARAFMVTGDTKYLTAARNALDFMYQYGWDNQRDGWYFSCDESGALYVFKDLAKYDPNTYKWSYIQHFALMGITAMYDATRNATDWAWLPLCWLLLLSLCAG